MDVGTFFVYGLFDPAEPEMIRYVGQTKSMSKRLIVHRTEKYYDAFGHWKWAVRFFGREFEMRLIEVVYGTRRDSQEREQFHIRRLESESGRLMNGQCWTARVGRSLEMQLLAGCFRQELTTLRSLAVGNQLTPQNVEQRFFNMINNIDLLETKLIALRMCTRGDCFLNRARELAALKAAVGS